MREAPTGGNIIKTAQRIMSTLDLQITLADAIRERDPTINIIPRRDWKNITRSAIIARIWKHEGRKVLAMHPEIVRECQLASSDKIPTRNLRALPFLSPMVVFPEPPEFESWAAGNKNQRYAVLYKRPEAKMRLLGFLTYSNRAIGLDKEDSWGGTTSIEKQFQTGPMRTLPRLNESMYRTFEQVTFNTHDPQAISFGVLAVLEVTDEYGIGLDAEVTTLSIPFQQCDATLAEIVDDSPRSSTTYSTGSNGTKRAPR